MYGAALALAALLSVFIQGFDLWSLALLATIVTALVFCALLIRYDAGAPLAPRTISIGVGVFATWLVVCAQLSPVVAAARLGVVQQLLMPLAFAAFAFAPHHAQAWRAVTTASAVLICGLAIAVLSEPLLVEHPTFSAVFVQRNSLSGYLLVVVLMLVPRLAAERGGRGVLWWSVPVFLGLFVISFSASRGAIGALIVSVAGLYVSLHRQDRAGVGKLVVVLALWAFLLADLSMKGGVFDSLGSMRSVSRELFLPGLSAVGGGDASAVRQYALRDVRSLADSKLASANERLLIWSSTVAMLRDAPWHGFGPGTFRLVYPAYAAPEDRSSLTYAHNDYLQIAAELGMPGILIVAVLGGLVARRWWTYRRRADASTLEGEALFWAMTAAAVHSVFTYNFYVPATLVMFGIVLARFEVLTRVRVEAGWRLAPPSRYLGRPMFVAVTGIFALAVIVTTASAAVMARSYEHGVLALTEGRLEEARRSLARAALLSPNARVDVAQAHLYLAAFEAAGDDALIDLAAAHVRAAESRDPFSPTIPHARMLVALQRPATPASAATVAEAYRHATRRDPRYFPVRLDLANHLRQRGENRQARAVLEQGMRYPAADHPLLVNYLQLLAQLRRNDGDEAGAREAEAEFRRLGQRLAASP